MSAAGGGGYGGNIGGPQIGGGPAPIGQNPQDIFGLPGAQNYIRQSPIIGSMPQPGQGPAPVQQSDIYSRLGGQPNADSDPNTAGYQPPTGSPMQPPAQVDPGMPGGKGGFPSGPQKGFGPVPVMDPNALNPLGPEGQQSTVPQQNASGGKGGFGSQPQITQQQFENFASQFFK